MTDASARRFEVPTTIGANSVRNFKSKSDTRIINLPVPPCSPSFVSRCAAIYYDLRQRSTQPVRHHVVENPLPDAPLTLAIPAAGEPPGGIGKIPQDRQRRAAPPWDNLADRLQPHRSSTDNGFHNNGPRQCDD